MFLIFVFFKKSFVYRKDKMQISSLDTIKGRKLLKNIYFNLKFNRQINSLSTLMILLRICVNKDNLQKYSDIDVEINHNLGLFRGTALWMQEIFNRYYFSMLNAFVYFGAAILLLLVGIRRFSDLINDTIVIFGFVLEASLLILMFIFLLFSPKDDIIEEVEKEENADKSTDIIEEIGEIARDFADASLKLGYINQNIIELQNSQKQLINTLEQVANNLGKAISPNDEMIRIMQDTNSQLSTFNQSIAKLNAELQLIKQENIDYLVRKHLENLLLNNLSNESKD